MSHTIYVGKIAKRRNSTYQPTLNTSFDVLLKSPTSLHTPTFTINAASFDYNYIKWGDRYYFVTDVVSRNNSLWEVSAVCDVLATYKADIIASTQFVSYSSQSGGAWLADTRIPILKDATVATASSTMNFLFNTTGFYVLSTIGKNGCDLWAIDRSRLGVLLDRVNDWSDDLIDDIVAGNYPWSNPPQQAVTYDWDNAPEESLAQMNMLTGFCGNAYSSAPDCIRSCIWVPFFATFFTGIGSDEIMLGQFKTGVTTFKCSSEPAVRTASVSIPWQFSDWRRAVCEEVYLYLPLVGLVSIPSDEIIKESSIDVTWSATATDGCIAYLVKAGNQVIGTYGANCSVNYPLGISQQASAGEIVQTAVPAIEKTVSSGIKAVANPSVKSIAGAIGSAAGAAYDIANVALTRYNSCIGGIGGGAGTGLSLDLTCFTVAHDTVVAPATMGATMGLPTMKPLTLSTLTGYCQCANAHVGANGAEAQELDEIDGYLNSGFYIE